MGLPYSVVKTLARSKQELRVSDEATKLLIAEAEHRIAHVALVASKLAMAEGRKTIMPQDVEAATARPNRSEAPTNNDDVPGAVARNRELAQRLAWATHLLQKKGVTRAELVKYRIADSTVIPDEAEPAGTG